MISWCLTKCLNVFDYGKHNFVYLTTVTIDDSFYIKIHVVPYEIITQMTSNN